MKLVVLVGLQTQFRVYTFRESLVIYLFWPKWLHTTGHFISLQCRIWHWSHTLIFGFLPAKPVSTHWRHIWCHQHKWHFDATQIEIRLEHDNVTLPHETMQVSVCIGSIDMAITVWFLRWYFAGQRNLNSEIECHITSQIISSQHLKPLWSWNMPEKCRCPRGKEKLQAAAIDNSP